MLSLSSRVVLAVAFYLGTVVLLKNSTVWTEVAFAYSVGGMLLTI